MKINFIANAILSFFVIFCTSSCTTTNSTKNNISNNNLIPDGSISLSKVLKYNALVTCHDFITDKKLGLIMKYNHLNYEKCIPLFSESIQRCLKVFPPQMLQKSNNIIKPEWQDILGKCFVDDFIAYNLS